MKIIYVGPLNKGGTCLQRFNALVKLEHNVVPINTMPFLGHSKWKTFEYKLIRKFFGPQDIIGINKVLIDTCKKFPFELLWIDKGILIKKKTLLKIKNKNIRILSYTPDDMLNPNNGTKNYLECVNLYDYNITTKTYNVPEIKLLGGKNVYFIGNAFCPDTHVKTYVSETEKQYFGGEVGFIGSFEEERANSLLFLAQNNIRIKVWGAWPVYWSKILTKNNIIYMCRELIGLEYAKAINSFDINLNFLRKVNRDKQTTRSIEIPASGGFMLSEYSDEHNKLFEPDKEAVYFKNNLDLLKKIKYYLQNKNKRKIIANNGYKRAVKYYKNEDRLAFLLKNIVRPVFS